MKSKWLILIFLSFFLIEIFSQFTWDVIGDDQVYFYMGSQVAGGKLPYKDFFYAHPPLQLFLYGFLFKFISFSHTFRVFFILLTILNAYLLYSITKKEFSERVALLSVITYLYAPTIIYNASYEYGLTIGMTFFLLGVKYYKIWSIQVFLFLLASFYRFHFVFLIAGYYAYFLFNRDKEITKQYLFRCFMWVLIFLFINLNLVLYIPNYLQDVFLYHSLKPQSPLQTFLTISTIIKINYLLFILPLILLLFYIKDNNPRIALYFLIPIPFLIYLSFNTFFGYYFVILMPFLAIISGYTLDRIRKGVYTVLIFFVVINVLYYTTIVMESPNFDINNKLITGDPTIVSYLALNQNNRVMNGDVDLNSMRYESKLANITELIQNIKKQHPIVVARQDEGLYARNKELKDWLGNSCVLNATYKGGEYLTFKC